MFKSLSTLLPYLGRQRKTLAVGMGALVLKDALAVSLPLVLKRGVDSLTAGFQLRIVIELAPVLIGISLLKGVFQYFMRVIIIGLSRDIEYDIRNDLFAHLV